MEDKINIINMKLKLILSLLEEENNLSYEEKNNIVKFVNKILIKTKITKKYEKELMDKIKEKLE